jgi:phosphohistidine phosphatase SixA
MVRGLRPDDPPHLDASGFGQRRTGNILLVGHMTNIADLAHALVPDGSRFPLHGLIRF